MNKVPVTVRGHELMKDELRRLKSEERPAVIKAIAEARAHGDLKENAEYHAAKEQQGFIEARIKDLEGKLSHVQVIDVTEIDAGGKVIFGCTVELLDVETDSAAKVAALLVAHLENVVGLEAIRRLELDGITLVLADQRSRDR